MAAASNLNTLAGDLSMSAGLILGKDLSSNTAFRDHITSNLKLTGDALTAANAWLDGQLNAGAARGDIVATAVTFLATLTDTTSPFYAAAQTFNTTVASAVTWSTGAGATTFGVSALRANQGNVDVVAGSSFTLTTGTDTLIGTAGNDTFTGADTSSTTTDQYQDTDRIVDSSTTDSDTANLTLVAAATPQVVNVEIVNAQVNSLSSVTLTASGMTGVQNLTVTRGDVVVGGSTLAGNKAVVVDGLNAGAVAAVTAGTGTTTVTVTQAGVAGATVNANTASGNTTVTGAATVNASGAGAGDTVTVEAQTDSQATTATNAVVQNAKAVSVTTNAATVSIADNTNKFTGAITVNAPAASSVTVANAVGGATVTASTTSTADSTIAVTNIDNTGATIVTGTGAREVTTPVKQITINLDGTTATTDAVSISGNGWIAVDQDVNANELVDNITLSGVDAAVTFDMTGTELATYTLTGSQNVTLRGDGAIFTGKAITNSTTGATTTLTLDTLGADADLSAATVNSIVVGATGTSRTLTLATGASVVLAADQTTAFAVAGKASGATINLSTADDTAASGATIDLTTATLTASSNVSVLNIDATVGKLTLGTALTAGATTTVNVSGTKDVALGAVTAKTVNAANLTGDLTIGSAASTALTTVASGAGDDSISVNAAAAYSITTGDGADAVTLGANALAASSVVTGTGDDEVTVNTTAAVVIVTESGNDTVTVGGATTNSVISLGEGVDKVVFTTNAAIDMSSATNFANFAMLDVEEVDITAVSATLTINTTSFAKDNTFKLTGDSATADILRVKNVSSTAGATIDASNITFTKSSGLQLAKLELEGGAKTDTITGSSMNDTIIGTKGGDTVDGGSGTDTFDATGMSGVAEVSGATNNTSGVVINLGATAVTAGTIAATSVGIVSGELATVGSGKVAYLYGTAAADNSSVQATLSSIENVIGSAGADYIIGSAGNNVITGGEGDDYIIGGAGVDTFVFAAVGADNGADKISGFTSATDILNLDAYMDGITKLFEAEADASVATSITTNANVIAVGGAVSIDDAATFIAGDATVLGTTGIIIVDNGTDSFVYYTDNLAGNGTEVLVATLLGVAAAEALVTADFLFA
ncbi:calcium-binding protein [Limnohabitans sp. Rim28]|uniref:beta strand repeat-containing protein n=1 Tax=Limnohabitans sp. Rim28 TaxID=1100720 RepID=UPI001865400E|nr:calcium-binding protein [Limnohabitans sp. Rim28]